MSTADHPDALTRRIEQLAAASSDEPDGEGAAVAALVGALRAEIGAVQAELGPCAPRRAPFAASWTGSAVG